ncbi:hypothetical protein [Glutamicibacter sp.]|jgi:hypothetical protein|uniref:hypothetical protein n=1 Tax=Glutamicibacter sp. TaxID=1931995 RepID=UPI002B492929|nr:hypothetical protein [Glutamicibacter sp.]HJX79161.1 hypothetical protein [Glutamicibacter sp.]
MNKILIGVAITALLVITGIVIYEFAEQQYAKLQTAKTVDPKYGNCDLNPTYYWCEK